MFKNRTRNFLFFSTLLILIVFVITTLAIGERGKLLGKPVKLKAELELYKLEYLLREPIIVKMRVTNIGKEEGWLYFVTKGGLKIKDSKGQEYTCHVSSSLVRGIIKPGQTLEEQTNLLLWFGIPETKFKIHFYLPPEKYSIRYEPRADVNSEIFEFLILEPKGDELKAMNLLKESYDLFIKRKWEESTNKMIEIYKKYPESKYAPYALLRTANNSEDFNKLIEGYPESREAIKAITAIADIFKERKDKTGYINSMNNLIKKFPNTDVSKEAAKQLTNVKEEDFK